MKAAVWARVSTREQETENQIPELREWARNRGMEIVTEYVLEESAWNGRHRAKLASALDDARMGRFDVLLVWALDRLSREGIEETLSVMRQFHERGVAVWSRQESWTETSDRHVRELITAIMAWVAQMESVRRSERIKAGIERRKREDPTFKGGRKPGAVDRKPRKRRGKS